MAVRGEGRGGGEGTRAARQQAEAHHCRPSSWTRIISASMLGGYAQPLLCVALQMFAPQPSAFPMAPPSYGYEHRMRDAGERMMPPALLKVPAFLALTMLHDNWSRNWSSLTRQGSPELRWSSKMWISTPASFNSLLGRPCAKRSAIRRNTASLATAGPGQGPSGGFGGAGGGMGVGT